MSGLRGYLKRARARCEAAIVGSVGDVYTTWQGINDLKGNSDIARLNDLSNKNTFTIQILLRQKRKAFWVEMCFEGGFNVKDIPRFDSIDEPSESHVTAKNACARMALSWFMVGSSTVYVQERSSCVHRRNHHHQPSIAPLRTI